MKILVLPAIIDLNQIGPEIVPGCDSLLTDQNVQYRGSSESDLEVHRWLKHRYDHLPLLRLRDDPDVTSAMIQEFMQDHGTAAFYQTDDDHGLTPLHILTRYNAFASDDVIMACFGDNPSALFICDREGLTPLQNLWNGSRVDMIIHFMQDLCVNHGRTNREVADIAVGDDKKRKNDADDGNDHGL